MYRCWFLHTTDGPIKFSFIKFKVLRYVTCLAPRGKWDYKAWHEDIIAPADGTKPWRDTIARRLGSDKAAATCGVSLHSCFGIPVTLHLWWLLVEASILFRGCICHCSISFRELWPSPTDTCGLWEFFHPEMNSSAEGAVIETRGGLARRLQSYGLPKHQGNPKWEALRIV